MEALNKQIRETELNLNSIQEELDVANQQRQQTVAELEKVTAAYEKANQDIAQSQEQIKALEVTKNTLEQAKVALDQKVATLTEEQSVREADIERLNILTEKLNKGILFVREGQIIFRAGEVITNVVVSYTDDEYKRVQMLSEIVYQANKQILDRLDIKDDVEALWISQAEFNEAIGKLSSSGQKETVVRVIAAGNIVYGEPVRVQIKLYPNHRIYNQNDLVYSEIVTVAKGDNAEQVVLDFLSKVNEKAIAKGILPDPIRRTVGSMTGSQFYDIVNNIENLSGQIEISAYAGDAVNASGPLRLNVYVKTIN